jgi:hypothetical protein
MYLNLCNSSCESASEKKNGGPTFKAAETSDMGNADHMGIARWSRVTLTPVV